MTAVDTKDRAGAVAIAKDVLKQLKTLGVTKGRYVSSTPLPFPIGPDEDLQACVDDITPYCHVCALGALFLSKARLFNDAPVKNLYEDNAVNVSRFKIEPHLELYFGTDDLLRIEYTFEKWYSYLGAHSICAIEDPKERLWAIMMQIIESGGYFKP